MERDEDFSGQVPRGNNRAKSREFGWNAELCLDSAALAHKGSAPLPSRAILRKSRSGSHADPTPSPPALQNHLDFTGKRHRWELGKRPAAAFPSPARGITASLSRTDRRLKSKGREIAFPSAGMGPGPLQPLSLQDKIPGLKSAHKPCRAFSKWIWSMDGQGQPHSTP